MKRTLLLLFLLTLAALPSLADARRALLIVSDAGDPRVVAMHRRMVDRLKEMRAAGHYSGIADLHPKIKVYDANQPAHAQSLRLLKIDKLPFVGVVALDRQGLPSKVLWGSAYTVPADALASADNYLGLSSSGQATLEKRVVLVYEQESAGTKALVAAAQKSLAGLQKIPELSSKLLTYSFARKQDLVPLEKLGLSRQQAPWLAVVRMKGDTYHELLWSTAVKDPNQGLNNMLEYVHPQKGGHQVCFLVWNPGVAEHVIDPTLGKLEAALQSSSHPGLDSKVSGAVELPEIGLRPKDPTVALVDCNTEGRPVKLLWSVPVAPHGSDQAVEALMKRISQPYQPPARYIGPQDASVLMRIPGGNARVGSLDTEPQAEGGEKPMVEWSVQPFYLSRNEVTVDQFQRFVGETGYRTAAEEEGSSMVGSKLVAGANWQSPLGPPSKADPSNPVEHVNFDDAVAYGAWAGMRLPGEREWEYAARGSEARRFPWGNEWSSRARGGTPGLPGPSGIGMFPEGASPFGCLDMAGNVEEWVNADYKPHHPSSPGNDFNPQLRVVKGGSWMSTETADLRPAHRRGRDPHYHGAGLGFRVASE